MGFNEGDVKSDNEPMTKAIAEAVRHARLPQSTLVRTSAAHEHQDVGPVERAHETLQSQIRAIRGQFKVDTGHFVMPDEPICAGMVRHAGRFLHRTGTKQADSRDLERNHTRRRC